MGRRYWYQLQHVQVILEYWFAEITKFGAPIRIYSQRFHADPWHIYNWLLDNTWFKFQRRVWNISVVGSMLLKASWKFGRVPAMLQFLSSLNKFVTLWQPLSLCRWSQTDMMTSWNGNICRVTGPLCGEFTGHRWIPCTNASDAELWYFLLPALE